MLAARRTLSCSLLQHYAAELSMLGKPTAATARLLHFSVRTLPAVNNLYVSSGGNNLLLRLAWKRRGPMMRMSSSGGGSGKMEESSDKKSENVKNRVAAEKSTKLPEDLKIDLGQLDRELEESLKKSEGQQDKLAADFMNFRVMNEKEQRRRHGTPFSWSTFYVMLAAGVATTAIVLYMRKLKLDEREKMRKRMIGKANIGGEWELVNMEGGIEGTKELLGNWLLIYFGFTNCPDICPEQIEKMVHVVDMIEKKRPDIKIIPLFFSVDPHRDTVPRIKAYCAEFSPKLRGYTGNKEQIEKVTRSFRVYYSAGPKNKETRQEDYIVDHTVIIYLIDPDGQFYDYYGQNRSADEIFNAIQMKTLKHEMDAKKKAKGSWFIDRFGGGEASAGKQPPPATQNK